MGGNTKIITVVVPTCDEEENVPSVYQRVKKVFQDQLPQYDWRLLFVDNYSQDSTRRLIADLCEQDAHVQAIFNGKNYGFSRSTFYGLLQAQGDAAVLMYADMQDPPEVIPRFVDAWEQGHPVVCGQKMSSKESKIMQFARKQYYKLMDKFSEYGHIRLYNGFGLYASSFLAVLKEIQDPIPYLRGIVVELAPNIALVPYDHEQRKSGKSKFDLLKLIDYSLSAITSTSKIAVRMSTLIGIATVALCFLVSAATFVRKILYWETYPIGTAATIIGIFMLGGIQLLFIGLLGEYITSINLRVVRHPLVIEEKRINLPNTEE